MGAILAEDPVGLEATGVHECAACGSHRRLCGQITATEPCGRIRLAHLATLGGTLTALHHTLGGHSDPARIGVVLVARGCEARNRVRGKIDTVTRIRERGWAGRQLRPAIDKLRTNDGCGRVGERDVAELLLGGGVLVVGGHLGCVGGGCYTIGAGL